MVKVKEKEFILNEENGTQSLELENYINLIKWQIRKLREIYKIDYNHLYTKNDALNDGILAFYEARSKYNPNIAKFSTYLFYYVKRNFLDGFKSSAAVYMPKVKKTPYINNPSFLINLNDINEQYENGETFNFDDMVRIGDMDRKDKIHDELISEEIYDIILKVLDILSGQEKEIIKLYYGVNCKQINLFQISKKFNITKQAVSYHIHHGLNKIKEYLVREYPGII